MRKKPTRKRPYFMMESAMTAILRDASGKMHHGLTFSLGPRDPKRFRRAEKRDLGTSKGQIREGGARNRGKIRLHAIIFRLANPYTRYTGALDGVLSDL